MGTILRYFNAVCPEVSHNEGKLACLEGDSATG